MNNPQIPNDPGNQARRSRETTGSAVSRALWLVTAVATALLALSIYLTVQAARHATAESDLRRQTEELIAETRREKAAVELAQAEAADRAREGRERVAEFRAAAQLVRGRLYDVHLRQAQLAWEEGRVQDVLEFLERERPKKDETDLRHFEWFYWNRLCHRDRMTLPAHSSAIRCLALSRSGTWIAAAGDGMVELWDAATGEEKQTFVVIRKGGGDVVVQGLALSPDGTRIASTGPDQTVEIRDTASGAVTLTLHGFDREVDAIAYSPDGSRVATANQNEHNENKEALVKLWDAATGDEILTFKGHQHSICRIAYSPDGKRIATASLDDTVKVWDAETGAEKLTFTGHTDVVHGVAFSPDGSRIASASWDLTVKVWDSLSGAEIHTFKGHTSPIWDVAFSPGGTRIASAAGERGKRHNMDNTIRLWDAVAGKEIAVLRGHTDVVHGVAFSPDGTRIVSAASDNTVKIWDTPTRVDEPIRAADVAGGPLRLAMRPDGGRVATAHEFDSVRVWDTVAGRQVLMLPVDVFALSPDGTRLAAPDRSAATATLWDTENGEPDIKIDGHTESVNDVAFSADGTLLATASNDHTARLWEAATGRKRERFRGHTAGVNAVAISPDASLIATGADDRTVKLWDPESGLEKRTLRGHTEQVVCVTFSPDGRRLVSVGKDRPRQGWMQEVKYWDATTGREVAIDLAQKVDGLQLDFSPDGKWLVPLGFQLRTLSILDAATGIRRFALQSRDEGPRCVAFSPDGSRLAVENGAMIQLWDVNTGKEIWRLRGHDQEVTSLVFSPDGARLASASSISRQWFPEDSTVKLWDVATGEETATLKGQWGAVVNIAFNRNGDRLVSTGSLGTIKVWDAPRGKNPRGVGQGSMISALQAGPPPAGR